MKIAINFESLLCSFFAIENIGLSLASALWSGVAILASFTWGLRRALSVGSWQPMSAVRTGATVMRSSFFNDTCCRVNGDELHNRGWAIPALLLLVGGLGGIAVNGRLSEGIKEKLEEENGAENRLIDD